MVSRCPQRGRELGCLEGVGEAGGGGLKQKWRPLFKRRTLEKAEHGMGMPYDAERVGQLRSMLREKKKLSAGLKARREQGRR